MLGMLRKTSLFAAGITLLLGSTAVFAEDQAVVLRGARILTMDEAKPEASAIALVDGRIAAIGSDADVAPFLKGAKVYDLPADALVLPGFQDSHNHLIWSATQAEDIDLTDIGDKEGLRAAIEPAMASLPKDAWIRGGGWSVAVYPDPSAEVLDEITGDRPA